MKTIEFKKLLKEDNPNHILHKHINSMIYLTDRQVQKVIDLKNGANK